MAEFKNHNEQSMEEILAAIKHIMAEEGGLPAEPAVSEPPPAESAKTVEAAPAATSGEASPPPHRLPPVQDAILDLTDRLDDDRLSAPPAAAAPGPAPAPISGRLNRPPPLKSAAAPETKRILSDSTLAASAATLSQIAGVAAAAGRPSELPLGETARTLEEMVRELLRPLLKDWLDAHLPRLVERLVRDEINRLVREAQER